MDEARSDAERKAQEFMDENEDLLDEGGYATLQKIFIESSSIATELSAETVNATNRLAAAQRAVNEGTKDPTVRPRKLFELERKRDWLRPTYERKRRAWDDFSAFIERVKSAYRREGGELPED